MSLPDRGGTVVTVKQPCAHPHSFDRPVYRDNPPPETRTPTAQNCDPPPLPSINKLLQTPRLESRVLYCYSLAATRRPVRIGGAISRCIRRLSQTKVWVRPIGITTESCNTIYMLGPLARFAHLMKVCRRRGRSQEEAEDLIQEAFLRLHEYCRTTEVRNEEAFLTRTVANLAINQYRREQIISYANETVEELEQGPGLPDGGAGPERILAAQQRLDQIKKVLEAVSERTCEIFLAHRAGYSYDEIAADLAISQRTVQKHIARAVFLLIRMKGEEQE